MERTNDFRTEHAAGIVEIAPQLGEAAGYFADYMARSETFGHAADGNQPSERAEAHGYELCIVTENIAHSYRAQGFPDEDTLAAEFVRGWIDSPPHRRNMIDTDVTEIGVGVARNERSGRYYAVQMFGTPLTQAIEFSIANEWSGAVEYALDGRAFALEPGQARQHLVCRPPEVEFQVPHHLQRPDSRIAPQAGDHFVIAGRNGEREPVVIRR